MAGLQDLLSWIDNKRRVVGRNLSDLVNDPANALEKTAYNTAQTVRELPDDPMNFVGGGLGRIKVRNPSGQMVESTPSQASMTGNLHSLGLVNDRGANALYNLGGKNAVDPELLSLIEDEMVRRGRVPQLGILPQRPMNDLMNVRAD